MIIYIIIINMWVFVMCWILLFLLFYFYFFYNWPSMMHNAVSLFLRFVCVQPLPLPWLTIVFLVARTRSSEWDGFSGTLQTLVMTLFGQTQTGIIIIIINIIIEMPHCILPQLVYVCVKCTVFIHYNNNNNNNNDFIIMMAAMWFDATHTLRYSMTNRYYALRPIDQINK